MADMQDKTIRSLKYKDYATIFGLYEKSSLSSILYELITNSLDANSTQITVHFNLELLQIRVSDNGIGIDEESLNVIANSHHSSKLHLLKKNDWKMYGSQGQEILIALADIVTMADISIQTTTKGIIGWNRLFIKNGKRFIDKMIDPSIYSDSHYETTTIIELNNIYEITPVRKKCINKDKETKDIIKMVTDLAIVHYNVGFKLVDEGLHLVVFEKRPVDTALMAFQMLNKKMDFQTAKITQQLHPGIWIEGLIIYDKQKVQRGIEHRQIISINGKIICNQIASQQLIKHILFNEQIKSIIEAHDLIKLNFNISCHLIFSLTIEWSNFTTINDIPNEEHKFIRELLNLLIMTKGIAIPSSIKLPCWTEYTERINVANGKISASKLSNKSTFQPDSNETRRLPHLPKFRKLGDQINPFHTKKWNIDSLFLQKTVCNHSNINDLKQIQLIGQFDKKFIVSLLFPKSANEKKEKDQTLLIIDQHAIHERIRLEQICLGFVRGRLQQKKVQWSFSVNKNESNLLESVRSEMNKLSIFYQICKNSLSASLQVQIHEIPSIFTKYINNNSEYTFLVFLLKCAQDIANKRFGWEGLPESLLFHIKEESCHGAIKLGYFMSRDMCAKLIEEWKNCKLPFICAHGRPSICALKRVHEEK